MRTKELSAGAQHCDQLTMFGPTSHHTTLQHAWDIQPSLRDGHCNDQVEVPDMEILEGLIRG